MTRVRLSFEWSQLRWREFLIDRSTTANDTGEFASCWRLKWSPDVKKEPEFAMMATRGRVRNLPAKAGSVKPEDAFATVCETGKRAARFAGHGAEHHDGIPVDFAVVAGGTGAGGDPARGRQPFMIAGRIKGKAMRNLNDPWEIVCVRAGLDDLRIHDPRHSYAGRSLALGERLPMIGRSLGHTQVETTARYAHLAENWVRDSLVRISDSTAAQVRGPLGPGSVEPHSRNR